MSELQSLLEKTKHLLDDQWNSFESMRRWVDAESALPKPVRQDWDRIYQLQDFLRRSYVGRLVEEAQSGEERPETFLQHCLAVLEDARGSAQTLLETMTQQLDADRGLLLSCSEQSSRVRILAAVNLREPNLTMSDFHLSRTILRDLLRATSSICIPDLSHNRDYSRQTSIFQGQVRSVLAVPIRGTNTIVGALYFDSSKLTRSFNQDDQHALEVVAPLIRTLFFASSIAPENGGQNRVFLDDEKALKAILGTDPRFLKSVDLLKRVAPTPAPVLLLGESGTGKELFAAAIHALSARKEKPLVAVNCAAVPETLIESELFGYEKGAFTGAESSRPGKIERARGGTLLLDEIGELKPELQAKLLRFLQSHEVERVGGKPVRVDVRIVSATNQNLQQRVAEGTFREDLYFRLNVFPIALPPIRERRSDVPLLAAHFLRKYADVLGIEEPAIDQEVMGRLQEYDFPGNVRELENLIYRSLLLSNDGRVTLECLPDELVSDTLREVDKNPFVHLTRTVPEDYQELARRKEEMKRIFRDEIAMIERKFAEGYLEETQGNLSQAARRAGIDRRQFYRLLGDSPKL